MQRVINVFCVFLLLLLIGCAQVVAPTGGPKDTTPPKAVSYSPDNKSTNFTGNQITIKFDEYIQLKDLASQLVVSPPLKYPLTTKIKKGRELEITIKDTLQNNTTYTFNFGDAIADINEGNKIPGFQYVFSTGSYIDSLKLSGHVQDAFTGDSQKGALVLLYSDLGDSVPYKKLPSYCGRTDANGNYNVENIKSGTYKLFVLAKSEGYFYHPYSENIGYADKPIKIDSNCVANLSIFAETEPKLFVKKASAEGAGDVMIAFNKPADSLSINPFNLPKESKPYTYIQYSITGDTTHYWVNTPGLDSLRFVVSRNNKIIDTAVIYSFPGKVKNKKGAKPEALKISCNATNKQTDFDYHKPIELRSEHPIMKYNLTRIFLIQHKDTVPFKTDTLGLPFKLALNCVLKSDSTYNLTVLPGAFTDVFGMVNDTMKLSFKVVEPTFFGSLKLSLNLEKQSHYLVQLLDAHGSVYRQDTVDKNGSVNYDALPPQTYRLRAIEDDNRDNKWTTGNYLKHTQPEKVFYFAQPITIRSNWDVTEDWQLK